MKAFNVSNNELRVEIKPWQNPTNFIPFIFISSKSSCVKFVNVISCLPENMNDCNKFMFVVWIMYMSWHKNDVFSEDSTSIVNFSLEISFNVAMFFLKHNDLNSTLSFFLYNFALKTGKK